LEAKDADTASANLLPLRLGFIAQYILDLVIGVWISIVLWQGTVGPNPHLSRKINFGARVLSGALLSFLLTVFFMEMNTGISSSMNVLDLRADRRELAFRARDAETACGHIDSQGLW